MIWAEKYRPASLKEVAGNSEAIKLLTHWAAEWTEGQPRKKALLLYGAPGTGKTSAAYALAKELHYDLIELNASDSRTRDVIKRIVGSASTSVTLDPKYERKVIVLDEVDGIHGQADYGGMKALQDVIRESMQPIVLIANDPYRLSREFRALTKMVEFKRLDQASVIGVLEGICDREGLEASEKVLRIIATNSNGDLRSAINDLQAIGEGRKKLALPDVDALRMRDSEIRIFDVLRRIFKTTDCDRAREAVWDSGEDPETILKWLAENLPLEYADKGDLARAFDRVSRSDVFLGRVMRRQEFGLMGYAVDLMSAGVATAKRHSYRGFTPYGYPEVFVLYARTRKKRELMESVGAKIGKHVHCSIKEAKEEYFRVLEMAMNNIEMGAAIASELGLTLEEIQYFAEEKRAERIHELAQRITDERIKAQTRMVKKTQASLFEFGGEKL